MEWLGGLVIYLLIGLVILLPILLYVFAVGSRKSYRCPNCGERITTEYLNAQHCNMCGAPLDQTES
ncbi:MAG: hypothetical protein JXB62_21575 [Pirellulales bacterium]|nr:hypothetical protein [Pirellulales bacterium]